MYKTITITLNKIIFYIEEEAYELLKEYLDSIRNRFQSSSDVEEILRDMEESIADKFQEKISKTGEKTITKNDVLEIIKIMGSVQDIEDESESNFRGKEEKDAEAPKRLYRNPDDVVIAGVCSGIAAYFSIDPTIVRLIFILTILFGGTGILVYLILWLVVPEARSNAQKMEMRGDPITLKRIEENVREKINNFNEDDKNKIKKIFSDVFKFLGSLFSSLFNVFKKLFQALGIIVGVCLLITAIASIFAVTFGAGIMTFNINTINLASDLPIKEFFSGASYFILVLSTYIFAVIPFVFLFFLGLFLTRKKNLLNGIVSGSLLGIWMISIISIGIIAVDSYPKVKNAIDEYESMQNKEVITTSYDLKDFSKIKISGYVQSSINYGKEYKVTAIGRPQDLEKLNLNVLNGVLKVEQNGYQGICFFCFAHPVKLEITLPELKSLELSGTSRGEISKFNFSNLDLILSGASKLSLGEIVGQNLNVYLSGASNIDASGKTENLIIKGAGASGVSGLELSSDTAVIDLSGASHADIGISNFLQVELSGASHLGYMGNPKLTTKISGASGIKLIDSIKQ